ncbi:MAG: helix-turn-helix transcriptional regulator [Bacilli bacterium]|nr:helix-turn-helix transcriptional regulator [Bacilli bacterium]
MNRLRDLRQDKDLYQRDIAKILDMSQTGYSQYETETNDIPTDILKKLAKFYNTSTDYILGLTNIKEPYPRNRSEK